MTATETQSQTPVPIPRRLGPGQVKRERASFRTKAGVITIVGRIVAVVALIGLWQLFSGRVLPDYSISNPKDVWINFWGIISTQAGWVNIGVTAKELALGFAIGVAGGTIIGLVLGYFKTVGAILEPFIGAVNGIPKIALAPVFVLILGIGTWTDATIAAMMVSLVLFYNIYIGMRTINTELVSVMRLMRANQWHLLRYVYAPSLLSPFFAGVKAAGPFAVLGVIIGEFVASTNGVGHDLSSASSNLNAAGVYSSILVLVLMGFVLNVLLSVLDRWTGRKLGMLP
ncbi:MAG TPA: ABC transporter permease [Pseudonocardiaceae bacterium]|nr:ABC transporter permease [Pseudonocardiaceae bacterium]